MRAEKPPTPTRALCHPQTDTSVGDHPSERQNGPRRGAHFGGSAVKRLGGLLSVRGEHHLGSVDLREIQRLDIRFALAALLKTG